MKPVNVLPVLLSQDADFKAKDIDSSLGVSQKGMDFSRLVERHASHDKSDSSKAEPDTAKSGIITLENGKKGTLVEETCQESDSLTHDSVITIDESNTSQKSQGNADSLSSENLSDTDASENKLAGTEELNESEQFISLLYNSDQTLTNSAEKVNSVTATSNQPLASTSDKSPELSANNTKQQLTSMLPSSSLSSEEEHKLKSFSPEELLIRASLKHDALTPQSSEKVLKESNSLLQSQQNINNTQRINMQSINPQNFNSEALQNNELIDESVSQNKANDLIAGLAQATQVTQATQATEETQVSHSQAAEQGKFNAEQLGGEVNSKTLKTAIDTEQLSKLAALKGGFSKESTQVNNQLEGSELASAELIGKEAVKLDSTAVNLSETGKLIPNVSDKSTEQLSRVNSDKLVAEQKSIVIGDSEDIAKEPLVTATKLTASQVAGSSVATGSINADRELQQSQIQAKAQVITDIELQATEEASEAFADSTLLTEHKADEPLAKTANKVVDSFSMRAASELHAQSIQTAQAKESEDAYTEFQSSEVLNHTVASDTAHIQKNNVQLQQETISMFRKDFTDAVKDKVMVMINQKIQQFDITLDPPEFGNMHVKVNLQGEQAAVNFTVQNQQAKDALEQNMHKLRDMLAEQGVDVGGANVEQQNQQGSSGEDNGEKSHGNQSLMSNQNTDEHNVAHVLSTNLFDSSPAGVDYYA